MMTSIFLSLLSVVLEDLWRGKLGFGFGMRVMRELCKKMRLETVLIGKERKLGESGGGGGGGGDVSAPKRRRIGTPSEPKVSPIVATIAAADAIVGGSPAGVNFALVTTDVSTEVPEPIPVKHQQNMLN
ncbi:unnamed protein product [Sphagnum balticum]